MARNVYWVEELSHELQKLLHAPATESRTNGAFRTSSVARAKSRNWVEEQLLIIEYYSHYIEIVKLTHATNSEEIRHSKSIFTRHGIPEEIFSDSGSQYFSEAYEDFSKQYQFEHKTSSQYYSQCNGEAERAVGIVKELLKKNNDLYLVLLAYRHILIQDGKYSPAELLMSQVLRSTLPKTCQQRTPQVPDQRTVRNRDLQKKILQKENFDSRHGARTLPSVHLGARVWIPAKQTEATISAN